MPDPAPLELASKQAHLDRIAAQVEACQRCDLHRSRSRGVPGTGPASARIMAIGEAPGEREDKEGKPFVGQAGQLLTQLLEEVGLSRDDIFITNVIKSRPPGNRDPLPEEVQACAAYLDEQIAVIQPQVILLLGRHALQRLVPDAPGISRCHGRTLRVGDRTYMPCYHPAAALYQSSLLPTLREDFQHLREHLDGLAGAAASRVAPPPDPTPEPPEQLGLF